LTSVIDDATELAPARVGLTPQGAAQLLLRAASGAAYDATSAALHKKHLSEIVRVIVSSMRK
jgi:hypothetical protein